MSKELNKAPVEQAGGDERDFQAKGAQEVPSPVSKEYDRHLISLLRKGEALPGHQEEAADEIERLRDWNDHLNNTVLPNILNPNFLMLMKGGERLLDLCTKDGEFIGVSLNDMKDVFDWMVTHARIAPDQAALAQPSPAQAEQAEVVAWRYGFSGGIVSDKACLDEWKSGGEYQSLMTVAQHERIVGALRFERQQMDRAFTACINERDAANARLHEVATACATAEQERDAALARVAELEGKLTDWVHEGFRLNKAFAVAQAQHSGPGKYDEVLLPFLKSMEHELHANAGKGDRPGWLQMDRKTALLEIYYHLGKLQKATKGNDTAGIVEYAADVANMSMMLVDVCGLLAAAPGKEGV
ncbi:hypothetical protein A9P19_004279 [Pseudomonas aeruginosa]|uniref:hypothetical protein n=1 Tax=Pseudomonas aeruginosa TaxID=287 RepID=UPI00163B7C78|nr:hypothetical protein [Pseudomonas aeruginosa]EIU7111453.1 hypothetical protein [Pseudomonas aeruginosa]HEJ3418444.1 hypothetical protein [Pseudomonas aeruginosa]HEJ9814473.1 hypothetical protein [Pseudomonas aeruginosa]HEJ9821611.1 hypothetical protein [Pseudomonas aeruginosa]